MLQDKTFSDAVITWQKSHGRHTLPWQNTSDPYKIWLSEIMLQQTQVAAVIAYYQKFLQRFPTVETLAEATSEEVMVYWAGLGYYSRARNLHLCAKTVVAQHAGKFPSNPIQLAGLSGIGRSTAAAIAAFSYGVRAAILDGNVKRVFARVFGIDTYPGERKTEQHLWQLAESLLPEDNLQAYTQGLMDLGATLCTRIKPQCGRCPLADRCAALATGRVAELPIRKPKKIVPEKFAVMLVVVDDDQILLTRRPDQGIWGGLYSLPELDGFTATATVTATAFNQNDGTHTERLQRVRQYLHPIGELATFDTLQSFSHGFTHFKLHVAAYRITLRRRLPSVGQTNQLWIDISELHGVALPAPISKLLQALFKSDDLFAD